MQVIIEVDVSELKALARKYKLGARILDRSLREGANASARIGAEVASKAAPVDRGRLAGSIKPVPAVIHTFGDGSEIVTGFKYDGRLGVYPEVMEYGRHAGGTFPNVGKLRKWVKHKVEQGQLFVYDKRKASKSKIDSLTYLIGKKIAAQGTDAREYQKAGIIAMRKSVQKEMLLALQRFVTRMKRA